MPNVCFTGRAEDRNGNFIERKDMIAILGHHGWGYHEKVYSWTDYLVASRIDTSKASAARAAGVRVISYATLWDLLDHGGASPAAVPELVMTSITPRAQAERQSQQQAAQRRSPDELRQLPDTPPEPEPVCVGVRTGQRRINLD